MVTGIFDAVGEAVLSALCAAGAKAEVLASNPGSARLAVDDLTKKGYPVFMEETGPLDEKTAASLINGAVGRFGRIDLLIHLARQTSLSQKPVVEALLWAAAVLPVMRGQGFGKIISLVSVEGKSGLMTSDPHLAAASGAILAMTRQLAKREAVHGVRVNAVACGFVEGDAVDPKGGAELAKIPAGRTGRPEDMAAALLFLASDSANFLTGETVDVNGGFYMA